MFAKATYPIFSLVLLANVGCGEAALSAAATQSTTRGPCDARALLAQVRQVAPLEQRWVSKPHQTERTGAVLVLAAEFGATRGFLERTVACLQDHPGALASSSPFAVPGAQTRVVEIPSGYALEVSGVTRSQASEIWQRAERLAFVR